MLPEVFNTTVTAVQLYISAWAGCRNKENSFALIATKRTFCPCAMVFPRMFEVLREGRFPCKSKSLTDLIPSTSLQTGEQS